VSEENIAPLLTKSPEPIDSGDNQSKDYSLETLVLLINTERLKHLQEKTESEFSSLKERQETVAKLHNTLKAINAATDTKGQLTVNEEIKKQIQTAKELGVEIDGDKRAYNRDERERLVENIRMTIDDLSVQNDMQLQTISRLTNERFESYQMARSILKPLHDAKTSLARAVRG